MIELSDKFQLDISSNTYSIQPLIVIDNDNNPIYISTYKQNFNVDEENSVYWEDYDLSIANITESIDLKAKSFKTSNLNFSLTNYKVNEKRFSDDIAQYSLINKYVDVYYKTQSCRTLEDCCLVYKGIIKSVKHDSKRIKIVLEDLTEDKLTKEVPVANLGYTDKIFNDKYINKEIPITYGEAFKAPGVLYVDKNVTDGVNSLFAITDDVFNSASIEDREINLGNFALLDTPNKVYQFTNTENPLFIYKDEYFQVFQQHKHRLVGGDDEHMWQWDWDKQYHQESGNGNVLSIPREFIDGIPQNPPAYNEFQAFIVRTPVNMVVTTDSINNDYSYLSSSVLQVNNPELAYDNADSYFSSNYNVEAGYGNDPYGTFMESPPSDEIDIEGEFEGYNLVSGFIVHETDGDDQAGCWLPKYGETISGISGEHLSQYQFKVFQYLHFNMDKLNRYDVPDDSSSPLNTKVQYIQMPTVRNVRDRLNKILSLSYHGYMGNLENGVISSFNSGAADSAYPEWFQDRGANQDGNGMDNRMQAYPFICSNFMDDFQDRHNISNSDFWWGDTDKLAGATNSNQIFPQATAFRFAMKKEIPGDPNWWVTYASAKHCLIVSQRTAFMTGGSSPYNGTFDDDYTDLGADAYGMEDAFNESDDPIEGYNECGIYYDLFYDYETHGSWRSSWDFSLNMGDYGGTSRRPFLFSAGGGSHEAQEVARYTPVRQETLFRTDNAYAKDFQAQTTYECIVSATASANAIQNADSPNDMYMKAWKYFGIRGQGGASAYTGYGCTWDDDGSGTHPVLEKHIYRQGTGKSCWAIWVKQDINGVDEEMLHNEMGVEFNPDFKTIEPNQNLTIQRNTILPCLHMTNTSHGEGWNFWRDQDLAEFQSTGTPQQTSGHIQIYDNNSGTGAPDNRFGFSFQLEDIEASDVIKCDTVFTGKIHCIFDEDATSDSATDKFVLRLSTAHIESRGEDFDPDAQHFGDMLIERVPLSDIHDGDNVHIWSSNEEDQQATSDFINHFVGTDEEWISQSEWTEPNFFNGFSLNYTVEGDNSGTGKAYLQTKIYDVGIIQSLHFKNVFDADLYIAQAGRQNNPEDFIEDDDGNMFFKYTGESSPGDGHTLIKQSQDILYHFIEKELGMIDLVDEESLHRARAGSIGNYAFSINKTIKAKDFINDFMKSTNMSLTFDANSKFSFSILKETYDDSDVSSIINANDIIDYSFSRTPVNDIYTIVNVKYAYDYAKDKYSRETGYVDGYDLFGNGDSGFRESGYSYDYLKLERDDNVLEFESKYIRDDDTALALRNFLYLMNCNQHNIFELTLPNKYIFLESGDIIAFNELIDNVNAYGEDYSYEQYRNNQKIYPYFLITYCSKKENNVKIKCTQLHELRRTFIPQLASVTRTVGINDVDVIAGINGDYEELQDFLNGSYKYFTREQRRVADMDGSGYIDIDDLNDIGEIDTAMNYIGGDLNLDAEVNSGKLIKLISSILGKHEDEKGSLDYTKLEKDSTVNTNDILEIINQISEDENVQY